MKERTKTLLLSGALLVGSVGTTVALAQASGGATNTPVQAQGRTQQPSFTGSIPLPQDNQSEGAEAAAYASMAKVTLDQAVTAAQSSLGVQTAPSSAELGNENGFLVWEVVIGQQTVKVDAGDGKVLQTEQVGAEEMADNGESHDKNEGSYKEDSGRQEQHEGDTEDGN